MTPLKGYDQIKRDMDLCSDKSIPCKGSTIKSMILDIMEKAENLVSRAYGIKRDLYGYKNDLNESNVNQAPDTDPGIDEMLYTIESRIDHANNVLEEITNKLR